MSGMKLGAHPLVVAVAMGLLGPGAVLDESRDASSGKVQHIEDEPEAPTSEEFARVENLWHSVRTTID